MYKEDLVKELIKLAQNYGLLKYGIGYNHPKENMSSSIIFNNIEYNFHPKSWAEIDKNPFYKDRTKKIHTNTITKGLFEMQSSNSSDALAMNIFCYPDFTNWESIKKLFNVADFNSIEFGYKAKVLKKGIPDQTEVDIYINDSIIIECKLTEDGFYEKLKTEVEKYDVFEKVFHKQKLIQTEDSYSNYQLIRNILATQMQDKGRFILLCDMRRPDLVKSFYKTVRCIKDDYLELRLNCEIIFWQDIAKNCGHEMQEFLKDKYGIC